jgi:integrase/recombinase XerC
MATPVEMAEIVVADYDPALGRVWLPGREGKKLNARWSTLLPWDKAAIERRVAYLDGNPRALLVCNGRLSPERSSPANSMALRKILDRAGVRADRRVRPLSIRGWGARRLFDDGSDIEEVARRLGVRTLDSARRIIGLPDPEPDTPPEHRRRP